jgi:hypothetical protein
MFSLWNPARALGGSLLFGCLFVGQYFLSLRHLAEILMMLPYLATSPPRPGRHGSRTAASAPRASACPTNAACAGKPLQTLAQRAGVV